MASGYWEILHQVNELVYAKGGKDAGKTKFLAQLKVLLMLMYDWYNVYSLRRDLKQHSGSTKEHFVWAISLLSKILDFPVEIMFKMTKIPLEITHRYQGNVLKTFSGETNTENKVSSQEIGGIKGIVGMFDYDEPTSNKTPTEEKIEEEKQWWEIAKNSVMERGLEFATPIMLDWQMIVIACNPWQPNSSFDQLYDFPYVHLSREELKQILIKKYKYTKQVKSYEGGGNLLIMITNAMLIEDILTQTPKGQKEIAKRKHFFALDNISSFEETFYIGLSGYIEGGVFEHQREHIIRKENLYQIAPYNRPIALSFGVDYANKQDKMVLTITGYTDQYKQVIMYKSKSITPSEHRNIKFRDNFIATKFVMEMLRWLKRLQMPQHIYYIATIDGDFFRQNLLKQWEDIMKQPSLPNNMRYTISFREKKQLKVVDRIQDDKELMASGRIILDSTRCAGYLQEVNTLQWHTQLKTSLAGNDDEVQSFQYSYEPYRKKLMKGKRQFTNF